MMKLNAPMLLIIAFVASAMANPGQASDEGKSRTFRLTYGATLTTLPTTGNIRVWLPVPQSTEHQRVERLSDNLPGDSLLTTEPKYGNRMLYLERSGSNSGKLSFHVAYKITRHEIRSSQSSNTPDTLTKKQRQVFLAANRRVPVRGKPVELLADISLARDPLSIGQTLYDVVDQHVRYDKSEPGYGKGDVLWVCDSRFGNCTDFHSLFISLCRSREIPARFEIGFPLPPQRGKGNIGGYHCWAHFFVADRGWVPVDISEADKHPDLKDYYFGNLTEDRVGFTTGRDINLVPRQEGEPLNYFVYPYVEVDGKPLPKEQIKLSFSYEDVE